MADGPEEALERERLRAVHDVSALEAGLRGLIEASVSSNGDDEHDPEGATIGFERAQLSALLAAASARLVDIEAALTAVHDGRYGTCIECDRPIPPQRLAARPSALTCVDCAARLAGA